MRIQQYIAMHSMAIRLTQIASLLALVAACSGCLGKQNNAKIQRCVLLSPYYMYNGKLLVCINFSIFKIEVVVVVKYLKFC